HRRGHEAPRGGQAGARRLLHPGRRAAIRRKLALMTTTEGRVERGYEAVRDAFRANFEGGHEVGAAFCLYRDGCRVVDIWGGAADESSGRPWVEETTVLVFSTNKG